jgi:hypothetical protein
MLTKIFIPAEFHQVAYANLLGTFFCEEGPKGFIVVEFHKVTLYLVPFMIYVLLVLCVT